MNIILFEYRLVDIEVSLEKAIRDRLVYIEPYYVLSKASYAYEYFPADVGDTFAVIAQDYQDGGQHIVGLIGLSEDLKSYGAKDVEGWILNNLDQFIDAKDLEDWV